MSFACSFNQNLYVLVSLLASSFSKNMQVFCCSLTCSLIQLLFIQLNCSLIEVDFNMSFWLGYLLILQYMQAFFCLLVCFFRLSNSCFLAFFSPAHLFYVLILLNSSKCMDVCILNSCSFSHNMQVFFCLLAHSICLCDLVMCASCQDMQVFFGLLARLFRLSNPCFLFSLLACPLIQPEHVCIDLLAHSLIQPEHECIFLLTCSLIPADFHLSFLFACSLIHTE